MDRIAEFFSRVQQHEFGFCAVATIVIFVVYSLAALIVLFLAGLQKKRK
ncbi:MAG: hypothetical protein KIT34_00985 [Cyanobacteria bacterium TGS_CYA1]|nr:hypothetical protein [Cyanobacteria bacterium TGS_CYA1]